MPRIAVFSTDRRNYCRADPGRTKRSPRNFAASVWPLSPARITAPTSFSGRSFAKSLNDGERPGISALIHVAGIPFRPFVQLFQLRPTATQTRH